jgi:hypothetical protein
LRRLYGTSRAAGVWGILFVVLLLVSAAMVSLPTAAMSGARIVNFYKLRGTLIVVQQVIGLAALGAFVAFALSLPRARWLRPALWVFVAAELVTNLVPVIIVVTHPAAGTAHTLTYSEDIADAALSIAIAVFAAAATQTEPLWLRLGAYVVALANLARGIADPLGVTALDVVAPLAFVALVLALSIRHLVRPAERSTAPISR